MLKKKTGISLVLCTALVASLFVGCAKPAEAPAAPEATKEAPAPTEEAPAPTEEAPEAAATDAAPEAPADGSVAIPKEKLDTTLYVGVSIRTLTNPYLITISDGMDMFCKYLDSIGQKYEKQVLTCEGSNDKQVDDLKAFVAKANGNAILYVDPNESAIAPALADVCEESGAYMVTAWNKPDDVGPTDYTKWVAHHSPDNVVGGYNIAKTIFDSIGGKGKVLAVQGMLGNTAASDRYKGFEQALKEYPDIELLDQQTANWDTKEALNLCETWLSKFPDVNGIWCANDNMATGVLQALEAKGLKGKVAVAGIDGNTDIVDAVKSGNAVATVSSNGFLQGGYSLAIAYAAWTGQIDPATLTPEQRVFNTEATLITKDNVEDYIKNFVDGKPTYDFSKYWDAIAKK